MLSRVGWELHTRCRKDRQSVVHLAQC